MIGTNGGGFYNSNSAVPFENPNGLTNFFEMIGDPADPDGRGVHVRADGAGNRRHAWAVFAAMFVDARWARRSACSRAPSTTARRCCAPRGSAPGASHGSSGGQHDRQGDPLRGHRHGALVAISRPRPATAVPTRLRGADPGRRWHRARQHLLGRGDLRRGRLGPLRDDLLHPDRGVHRRADGRADARVPGQEDRGARDQAGGGRLLLTPLSR